MKRSQKVTERVRKRETEIKMRSDNKIKSNNDARKKGKMQLKERERRTNEKKENAFLMT
jgi:hypothetical protein